MIRRLVAVLTAVVLLCSLAVLPAVAGPGEPVLAQAGGTFRPLSSDALPFRPASVSGMAVKPMQAQTLKPETAVPRFGGVGPDKLEPGLAAKLNGNTVGSSELIDVLVTTTVNPASLARQLSGIDVTTTFSHALNGFAAKVTRAQLSQLQAMGEVQTIGENAVVQTQQVDNGQYWSGATDTRSDYWVTGDGDGWQRKYSKDDVVIAVIDTGTCPVYRT